MIDREMRAQGWHRSREVWVCVGHIEANVDGSEHPASSGGNGVTIRTQEDHERRRCHRAGEGASSLSEFHATRAL